MQESSADMASDSMTVRSLYSLHKLTEKTVLDVSNSLIENLLIQEAQAKMVIKLKARSCAIKDLEGLGLFINLEELDLGENRIKNRYLSLPKLRHLHLDKNPVSRRLNLTSFPNLTLLNISEIGLTSLKLVQEFPTTLKTFICRNNEITDLCEVGHLRFLSRLQSVDLRGNPCLSILPDSLARIVIKSLIFAEVNQVNGELLTSEEVLRAESLQMHGIGKFKPDTGSHEKIVDYALVQGSKEKRKTPQTMPRLGVRSPLQRSFTSTPTGRTSGFSRVIPRASPLAKDSGRPSTSDSQKSAMSCPPVSRAIGFSKSSPRLFMDSPAVSPILRPPLRECALNMQKLNLRTASNDDLSELDESYTSSRTVTISTNRQTAGTPPTAELVTPLALGRSMGSTMPMDRAFFANSVAESRHVPHLPTRTNNAQKRLRKKLRNASKAICTLLKNSKETKETLKSVTKTLNTVQERLDEVEAKNKSLEENLKSVKNKLKVVPTDVRATFHSAERGYLLEWRHHIKAEEDVICKTSFAIAS